MEDNSTVSACVGSFDQFGMPITITKHLSQCATVAFQTITLNLLLSELFSSETAATIVIQHQDGSHIRINRTLNGFTAHVADSKFV